jgi:2-polyprenyl-3-methyl-5-hydroxy-6-metoxy-1,4-benzoquinol methylase
MVSEIVNKQLLCPLCGSANPVTKHEFKSDRIIDAWQRVFQMQISAEFHGITQFQLLECTVCKLQFFEPRSLAGSPALYEGLEKFEWYYMPDKWEHRVALEDLEGCKNGIEVGCGFGEFVARVGREKPATVFEGFEQNPSAVKIASEKGIPVHLLNLEDLAEAHSGNYAAVCAFQVLEHVADPKSFVDAACKLLYPGGRLILGLPNGRSFLRHQFNTLDMPPHHMTRWTSEVLKEVERWFPLKIRRICYEPLADYHIDGYVEAYTDVLARAGVRVVAAPGLRSRLSRLLRVSGLRRFLRGQSIYVCYERT